jgi:hypothetical protein
VVVGGTTQKKASLASCHHKFVRLFDLRCIGPADFLKLEEAVCDQNLSLRW